jgi:hypothetical protein
MEIIGIILGGMFLFIVVMMIWGDKIFDYCMRDKDER